MTWFIVTPVALSLSHALRLRLNWFAREWRPPRRGISSSARTRSGLSWRADCPPTVFWATLISAAWSDWPDWL